MRSAIVAAAVLVVFVGGVLAGLTFSRPAPKDAAPATAPAAATQTRPAESKLVFQYGKMESVITSANGVPTMTRVVEVVKLTNESEVPILIREVWLNGEEVKFGPVQGDPFPVTLTVGDSTLVKVKEWMRSGVSYIPDSKATGYTKKVLFADVVSDQGRKRYQIP